MIPSRLWVMGLSIVAETLPVAAAVVTRTRDPARRWIAAAFGFLRRIQRIDLLLFGIAISAAYCLIALGTLSRWNVWLPGILPLGALWIAIVTALIFPARKEAAHSTAIGLPPPII